MPPHCDTRDGPVVKAAMTALEKANVNYILPYAPEWAESEIKEAYNKAIEARKSEGIAKEIADGWFFETVIRLHRKGEGAGFDGLKPAGMSVGPAIPLAEKALETGNPSELYDFLKEAIHKDLHSKLERAMSLKDYDINDVAAARKYISAMLDFQVHFHGLFEQMTGEKYEEETASKHEHHH